MALDDSEIRAAALDAASRSVPEGQPSGYVLSSARMFETYIRSGLTQVGRNFRQGVLAGRTGAIVRIDGDLSPAEAEAVVDAVTHLLTKGGKA